jgi:hypothetical protein
MVGMSFLGLTINLRVGFSTGRGAKGIALREVELMKY